MSDFETFKELVLWARENNVQLSTVTVGAVSVTMADLKLVLQEDTPTATMTPAPTDEEDWKPKNMPSPADMYADLARQMGMNGDREDFVPRPEGGEQ
jgi:hypothetical protein